MLGLQHGFQLSQSSVAKLSELYLFSIWYHELFHHYCDVQTYLSGYSDRTWRTRAQEEPLAVAYSRHRVGALYSAENYVSAFLELRYDYTKLKYYSDWKDYLSKKSFQEGLASYVPLPRLHDLRRVGFAPGSFLFDSVPLITSQEHYAIVFWWP